MLLIVKKKKNKVTSLYKDFEDQYNFTCEKLFELNKENIDLIKENENVKLITVNNLVSHMVKACEFAKVSETNDYRTVFERHYQYIRNGILSINDFSYQGLSTHILEDGTLSKASVFFNNIILNILEITNYLPHYNGINNLLNNLSLLITVTATLYICYDIIAILLTVFFITGINKKCRQILLLKQVFEIVEIQE